MPQLTFWSYFPEDEVRLFERAYYNEEWETLEKLCAKYDVNYALLVVEHSVRKNVYK